MPIPLEQPKVLPKNIELPNLLYEPENYTEKGSICWKLILPRDHKLYIEDSDGGSFRPTDAWDLLFRAKKYRNIFTFCPNNELDLIFRLFTKAQLMQLDRKKTIRHMGFRLIQYQPTKISIRKGNSWTSLINVHQMTEEELDTPLLVKGWLGKLQEFQNLTGLGLNVASTSTSARTLTYQILRGMRREFARTRTLSPKQLDLIYSTVHGTWMEPTFLGVSEAENVDLIKAHLHALGQIPSIRKDKAYISTQPKYTPTALMGFYLVEFDYPNMDKFALAPIRLHGRVSSPYGLRIQYLPKPYLDKLSELKIPFKVHKALEFLPLGEPDYFFATYLRIIEKLIDTHQEDLYPLGLKMLTYKTFVGSLLHKHLAINQPIEEITHPDDILWEVLGTFNPMIASTVYAIVNCQVFDMLRQSQEPYYRRHDASSRAPEDYLPEGFRKEAKGPMFTLNSVLHDNPLMDFWLMLARDFRHSDHLDLVYQNTKMGREAARNNPEDIGLVKPVFFSVYPDPVHRLLKKPIKELNQILDDRAETQGIPNIDQINQLGSIVGPQDLLQSPWLKPEKNPRSS